MGLKLFDGSDGSDADVEKISKIEINQEFAHRYEHNKKREDLQRLEELKTKGLVEDSSESNSEEESSEEEDALKNSSRKDLEFFNALIKIRNQDPILRNNDAKFFESETSSESEDENGEQVNGEEENNQGKRNRKEKPMYLKDVVSKHLIEEGPEFEYKEEKIAGVKSYLEEQEELKKAFFDVAEEALGGDDEGEEFLKVKVEVNEDMDNEDACEIKTKLDEYFGEDGKLDGNMMFLKDYFKNRMWADDGKGGKVEEEEESLGFLEDEEEIEKQEDYEREYNFRFEENAGDRVMGHSRFVEGSVRKKTNARKLQRKSKEERIAKAEFEREEELKRLKNLKKKEINEKLKKVREAAGIGEQGNLLLDEKDMEEEFDPDEYDRKMKAAFNEEYYEAEDANPDFGSDEDEDGGVIEKPDFNKEDELLGLPKGWDDKNGSSEGFLAARERFLKHKVDNKGDHEQGEEDIVPAEGKQKKKQTMSGMEKEVLQEGLNEYYKLDYEDTIGDLKTRFKYRHVNPTRYGLSSEEVLLMEDKELNQYVSLKKLAPFREKEWKVPHIKRYNQKQRNKSILDGEGSNIKKTGKKHSRGDGQKSAEEVGVLKKERPEFEESNSDMSNLSRKRRRKLHQAELKLSHSRLKAYGKIPSKAKHNNKH